MIELIPNHMASSTSYARSCWSSKDDVHVLMLTVRLTQDPNRLIGNWELRD
jgi:hypothetical protein